MSGERLVVLGTMGAAPFAGMAWQVLHHLEGFRRLGFDVYYFEDTQTWPYDPDQNTITQNCDYTVRYIADIMNWCGMPDRWAYRAVTKSNRIHGPAAGQFHAILKHAQILVNLTASTVLRDEHLRVPLRIYLETDPVLPQIEIARENPFHLEMMTAHTHHATYGENFGSADCRVPLGRFEYIRTRPPVILDWWSPAGEPGETPPPASPHFTTIASWKQDGKDIEWEGQAYTWSKHHEFLKVLDLPRRTDQTFELALARPGEEAIGLLQEHGWHVIDALPLSRRIGPYRDYITRSRGEFTVAKDQNVRLRSGWFSDRSACYLAAGRPVVTQDTAFGNHLPTGEGLFAFNSLSDIVSAISQINDDYDRHSRAAYRIAASYFDAETVLGHLLDQIGAEVPR